MIWIVSEKMCKRKKFTDASVVETGDLWIVTEMCTGVAMVQILANRQLVTVTCDLFSQTGFCR